MPDKVGGRLLGGALAGVVMCLFASLGPPAAFAANQTPGPDPLEHALDHFYNLEYDAAEKLLDARLKEHPEDLRALSYMARVWMERELFRRQMLEAQAYGREGEAFRRNKVTVNPQVRQKFFESVGRLERLAQARLNANPRDEDALYWLGVAHVIRAVYHLTLEKSTMAALSDAKEAQKYHAQLLRLDPNYVDAYWVVGTYDYIVASLPWYTRAIAALIGYSGNRQRGLEELKCAANEGRWARTDARTFLSILDFREKNYSDAIRIMEELSQKYPRNNLLPQQIARAYKAQDNWRAAADEYDSILQKYESASPGFDDLPAAKIYYQAGETYFHLGDQEQALQRYRKAAGSSERSTYVYRAELAAAAIELRQAHSEDARIRYERVAKAVPDTDEGRAAARALKSFSFAADPKSHSGNRN